MNEAGAPGRDKTGRFRTGNAGGPGNPLAGKIAKLRAALVEAVTDDDIREIARALIASAKSGDTRAIKELLDRTIGRPVEADFVERLEALEAAVEAAEERRAAG
jgi:hypothetical protein